MVRENVSASGIVAGDGNRPVNEDAAQTNANKSNRVTQSMLIY